MVGNELTLHANNKFRCMAELVAARKPSTRESSERDRYLMFVALNQNNESRMFNKFNFMTLSQLIARKYQRGRKV